jgi:ubiquinone/menaquinone biosynthesis C-methylase UbiE
MPEFKRIIWPYPIGGTILEVGGGEYPLFRPNMDIRPGTNVDIVCDLEKDWPIDNNSYDGILAKFVIEHLPRNKTKHFLDECYRIVKPGRAVFIVSPNTLEQCQQIVKYGMIGENESCMLFGGQDYVNNEHKAAFSKASLDRQLRESGFGDITIEDWPAAITDMYAIAYKVNVPLSYAVWSGLNINTPDIPSHPRFEWIHSKCLKEDRILDVGACDSVMWAEQGFNVTSMDIERDPSRGINPDVVGDAQAIPFPDKTFDVVVMAEVLEHLDNPMKAVEEAIRVAKRAVVITVPLEKIWPSSLYPGSNPAHKRYWTPDTFYHEIIENKFKAEMEQIGVQAWRWLGVVIDSGE